MKIPFFWWTGSWERPFNSSLIQTTLDRYQKFLWKMSHGAIVYNTAAKDKLINIGMNDKIIFIAQNTKDERVCLTIKKNG
jgi:phage gp46-like protein